MKLQVMISAVVDKAIASDNPIWGKRLASMLENQAKILRLRYGGSTKKERIPLGQGYIPATGPLQVKRAHEGAANNPRITAEELATLVCVDVTTARRAVRWAQAVRYVSDPTRDRVTGLLKQGAHTSEIDVWMR